LAQIELMKKLSHPNCVQLFEVIDDEEEDTLYMILEYVKKGEVMSWNEHTMRYR